jgi:hypothetical protein
MVAKRREVRSAETPSTVRDREQRGESPRVLFEPLDTEKLDLPNVRAVALASHPIARLLVKASVCLAL